MAKPYILLLTSRPDGWPATRLRAASKALSVPLRTANPANACLEIDGHELRVRYLGRILPTPSVVIPRLGPGNYENGFAMLEHYESMGVPVCNSRESIEKARDTVSSLLLLHVKGINVPKTARLLSIKDITTSRKFIPGPPWVLKTFTGAMGIGTMMVNAVDQLEAVAATIWALKEPILMQEYVRSDDNSVSDIRTLVIGGEVVGAIRRIAHVGEFRSNVHKGATTEGIELSKREISLAKKAANALGLEIAGVDWINTKDGPVVLEVNATPGFQGFERATGKDIAKEIIRYARRVGGL